MEWIFTSFGVNIEWTGRDSTRWEVTFHSTGVKIEWNSLLNEWNFFTSWMEWIIHSILFRKLYINGLINNANNLTFTLYLYLPGEKICLRMQSVSKRLQYMTECAWWRITIISLTIGVRGGGPGGCGPHRIFQIAIFGQKHVIFGQNQLIFWQAMEKIFGQQTSAPLNETGPVHLCLWHPHFELSRLRKSPKCSAHHPPALPLSHLCQTPKVIYPSVMMALSCQSWSTNSYNVYVHVSAWGLMGLSPRPHVKSFIDGSGDKHPSEMEFNSIQFISTNWRRKKEFEWIWIWGIN